MSSSCKQALTEQNFQCKLAQSKQNNDILSFKRKQKLSFVKSKTDDVHKTRQLSYICKVYPYCKDTNSIQHISHILDKYLKVSHNTTKRQAFAYTCRHKKLLVSKVLYNGRGCSHVKVVAISAVTDAAMQIAVVTV